MEIWRGPFVAMGLTILFLLVLINVGTRVPMDVPNHRSLHAVPVPRVGGIGLLAGVLAGWWLIGGVPASVFFLVLVLGVFSFLDDQFNLPVLIRLPVHLGAAAAVLMLHADLTAPQWSMLPWIILLGWMTNLFNFMDGSDGLAGGMALFGFASYGAAAWIAGDTRFAMVMWVVAAAAFGFLLFNFDPARVFLGDAGSIALGFLAGTFGLIGWRLTFWPVWFPILVFSPFIVDATVTLLMRIIRGEKFWQAHREHAYQRLIRSGWSHRRLALWAYLLMALCGVSGLLLRERELGTVLMAGFVWAFVYAALLATVNRRWTRFAAHP